jgi:hypothetical protein
MTSLAPACGDQETNRPNFPSGGHGTHERCSKPSDFLDEGDMVEEAEC